MTYPDVVELIRDERGTSTGFPLVYFRHARLDVENPVWAVATWDVKGKSANCYMCDNMRFEVMRPAIEDDCNTYMQYIDDSPPKPGKNLVDGS